MQLDAGKGGAEAGDLVADQTQVVDESGVPPASSTSAWTDRPPIVSWPASTPKPGGIAPIGFMR
jgi:hypothetical protein